MVKLSKQCIEFDHRKQETILLCIERKGRKKSPQGVRPKDNLFLEGWARTRFALTLPSRKKSLLFNEKIVKNFFFFFFGDSRYDYLISAEYFFINLFFPIKKGIFRDNGKKPFWKTMTVLDRNRHRTTKVNITFLMGSKIMNIFSLNNFSLKSSPFRENCENPFSGWASPFLRGKGVLQLQLKLILLIRKLGVKYFFFRPCF